MDRTNPSTLSANSLKQLLSHDQAAWFKTVDKYFPLVYSWGRCVGLDDHSAADVAQDVFRSVFTSLVRFKRDSEHATFRGWLHRIAQRRIAEHFERNEGFLAMSGTDAAVFLSSLQFEEEESPKTQTNRKVMQRIVETAKIEFEEQTWQAFWMTAIEGQEAKEVAEKLRVSRNSVYLSRSRVLRRLRQLGQQLGEGIEE